MDLTNWRSLSMLAAVAAASAVTALSVVLPTRGDLVVRGAIVLLVGSLMIVRAESRPESTASWRVVGVGDIVLGIGWIGTAIAPTTGNSTIADVIVVLGFTVWAIGFMVAVPRPRSWAANLDGSLFALAGTLSVAVLLVDRLHQRATLTLVLAAAMSIASLIGPGLVASVLAARRVSHGSAAGIAAVSASMLTTAGLLTAYARLEGVPLGWVGRACWMLGPSLAALAVLSRGSIYRVPAGAPARLLSVSRIIALASIALLPALTALLVGGSDARNLGVTASMAGLLVLVIRIGLSLRYDVLDVRAEASVRFDALVEHAAEVLAVVGADGKLFYVSAPMLLHFAIRPQDVLGRPVTELLVPDDIAVWHETVARAEGANRLPVRSRLRLLDGDGHERHVECTVVDLRELDGVRGLSLTINDISERVQLESELIRQVRTDDLTGLDNRHVMADRVDHVLMHQHQRSALLYLDINEFKLINDGYGHGVGDTVLAAVGERVGSVLRRGDSAARLGGDEFAILLEDLGDEPLSAVLSVASRIHERCSELVRIGDGEHVRVRVAVGVALAEPGWTGVEMFAAADAAMYTAKRELRSTVVFDASMTTMSKTRLQLRADLEDAIRRQEFEVHYQPIVELENLSMTGVEALLRWTHPTLGAIAPDQILEQADAAGLTPKLTDAILQRVGEDLRRWRDAVHRPIGIALNLSPQQLMQVEPSDVLHQMGVGAAFESEITIEVTETSMLGDMAAAARVLTTFRDAGCHVAVDDFGTGYASIGYLRRLPVDRLKIDREFIEDLTGSRASDSFAAVIQGLASALGLLTIAEGIETEEHLAGVRAIGCHFGQGWLFGRPMTMEALIDHEQMGTRAPISRAGA
jgi:diguanylate cyclase (GGDEF)-like protein/PAS domain S-box-containing protein